MLQPHHDLARAYFVAVEAGALPDSLLTDDFTAWTTTGGDIGKAAYQGMIAILAKMCAEPIRFTIDAITAEDDRVVAEARSHAVLVDGTDYDQTYVFAMRVRDGRLSHISEHYNSRIVDETLLPLMRSMG
jgi:ketosteroid isomerase-like protein